MLNTNPDPRREIIAALICSRMYFDLCLSERLALVKSLCAYQTTAGGR